MYDYLVIGKGLMGSAAFRYLSGKSANTLLVGPDEPAVKETHDGVFGAHYDAARLAHAHGKDGVWATLNRAAIANYRMLERESGISFYYPVGELFVADEGVASVYHEPQNVAFSDSLGIELQVLDEDARQEQFPYLGFAEGSHMVWERQPAGHINPRALIEAQVAIGKKQGGKVMAEQVMATDVMADHVRVTLKDGRRLAARRVLVAAGSFSNSFGLLPRKLALTFKAEYVVLGRVSPSEATRLQNMPVIHYDLRSPVLANIYMIQPVRYPDGHFYIKMGANTHKDHFLQSSAEMCAWYARGDSDAMLTEMRAAVEAMVPGIEVSEWITSRCVITRSAHRKPYIDTVVSGRLYVATGGNGSSASCSDAIGQLAADLVEHDRWPGVLGLDSAEFAVVYE